MSLTAHDDIAPHPVDRLLSRLSRAVADDLAWVIELAALVCGCERAALTLGRSEAFHVAVTHGFTPLVCSTRDAPCAYCLREDDVYVMADGDDDVRAPHRGWFAGRSGAVRFYASAPVLDAVGHPLGRLLVADSRVRHLDEDQTRALKLLGQVASRLIALRLARPADISAENEKTQLATAIARHIAAEISHDLRVPLASVVAGVELLGDAISADGDATVAHLLESTTRATDRMVRMLEHTMQDGVRAEAAVHPPSGHDVCDVASVARQLVLDLEPRLEAAGAVVHLGALPDVRCDPDQMYSLLQNLVTNAVKYARPGTTPEVHVNARRVTNGWRIRVQDNGIGIPEDRRVDVFSMGSRAGDVAQAETVGGHGIGLATVGRIVHTHGGVIGVDRSPSGGTEIWFELPAGVG